MAATSRLRFNGLCVSGAAPVLNASITNVATTITFAAQLTYAGGVVVPTIADPSYMHLTIEPDTPNEEVVWVTAYTSGATSATVLRGQETTTAVSHPGGAAVRHAPSAYDFNRFQYATRSAARQLYR